MNVSSAQPTCSITSSSDTITLSNITNSVFDISTSYSSDTITLNGSSYTVGTGHDYTIPMTQTISSIDPAIFNWKLPEEFIDTFPDFERVKKMCDTYPGLKIAYEKFVTTYKLVKDDYDNPNKGPL